MLLGDNNLWLFIISLIIGFTYIGFIYIRSPYKSINLKNSLYYLGFGALSITFVVYFFKIFPGWLGYIENESLVVAVLFKAFIQVALLEESAKLIGFAAVESFRAKIERVKHVFDHPIGTMFYVAMASMAFATLENFDYAIMSGEGMAGKTLAIRAFTSTLLHLLSGLFLGYWIALYRVKDFPKFARNKWEMILAKYSWIRRATYTLAGLLSATALHGIYDYVLFIEWNLSTPAIITILLIGLLLTYGGSLELIDLHKKKVKKLADK